MKQKGFIPIPIIIAITFFLIIIGGGVVLYETDQILSLNNAVDSFFSSTSGAIYKLIWEKKFETEMLKNELELSNIKKEQAEIKAEDETTRRIQEEIARGEAEQIAQEEIIKRNQAEAKAKQEEFEKKIKEEELAEKEAEEKIMNADNDGDGLTYREELKLGSSDWNSDSDGDGIKDNLDLHPAGGDRLIAQHFEWSYDGTRWTWNYSFPSDWYDYYKNKTHGPHGVDYVTSENIYIKEIAKMLEKEANGNNYTKSEFAVAFIQSLGYVKDEVIGYDDYPKYPLETLAEQNGDCEDTSYLAAAIIDAMNVDNVLIKLPGHMAIAIAFSGSPSGYYYRLNNGRDYYYIETTDKDWRIGEIPDEYRYTPATIIRIPYGEIISNKSLSYKKPCYASTDFSGYYWDGNSYYSDSNCNYQVSCLSYEDFYYNVRTENFYWDSSCGQIVVKGCSKSTSYSGYFTNGIEYYHDSRCTNKARICRLSSYSYDKYWDGYDFYWDSSCTQEVVAGCSKSTYYPGYFFDGWDYYYDYQCIQSASPY